MSNDLIPNCVIEKQKEDKKKRKQKFKMFPKAERPSILQCILNTEKSLHYFTRGTGFDANTMRDVTKEPTPYWFPEETGEVSYKVMQEVWKEREREVQASYDVRTKPNYRWRQMQDLLKRLYVPDVDDEKQAEPTLLDIDKMYFKIVEGRPIREKLDRRKYVETVQDVMRTRMHLGIFRDEATKLEEKYLLEQAQIDELKATHKAYVDAFDAFLEEDHAEAMKLLQQARDEKIISKGKGVVVERLHGEYGSIACAVYILEEQWRNLKMFQGFLYMISPMYWRQKHDYINRRYSADTDAETFTDRTSEVFRFRSPSAKSTDSLETLVNIFLQEIETGKKPELYFENPQELNNIFQNFETRNLNFLLQLEEMEDPVLVLKSAFENTTKLFEAEALFIAERLEDLNAAIDWEEERAHLLHNKANMLLNDVFKDLEVADNSLSLFVFVEDVYESCISPNDSNLGLTEMMQDIELQMESLLLKLDFLPHDVVTAVERQMYEEDARIMKDAYDAEVKLKLMEKLRYKLRISLGPPFKPRMFRPLMPRTEPPPPRKRPPVPKKPLTKEQEDFLTFFTDYCPTTDNAKDYLQINE